MLVTANLQHQANVIEQQLQRLQMLKNIKLRREEGQNIGN